jgi:hypothetical protein
MKPSSPDEIDDRIVADLRQGLPAVSPESLRREVDAELARFRGAPIQQYVPILVGRAVWKLHDHDAA